MGGQRLVHDVRRHVAAVGQGPEQLQHLRRAGSREHSRVQETEGAGSRRSLEEYLLCHVAVLIILGQSPDQLQQLLPLLGRSAPPARLQGELSLVPV